MENKVALTVVCNVSDCHFHKEGLYGVTYVYHLHFVVWKMVYSHWIHNGIRKSSLEDLEDLQNILQSITQEKGT